MHDAQDNPANENHVFEHVDVFIAQIGQDLGAERTLTALLTNNLSLLEQLDDTYVVSFLQLIKEQGKKPMSVQFHPHAHHHTLTDA